MGQPTVFQCPRCGQSYNITADQVPQYAGRMLACTRCEQRFVVPPNIGQAAAYGPVAYSAAAEPATGASGMSIAGLVCGCVVCVPFITGILGAIFGILGMRDARNRGGSGKGMAVAGLVLGCVNVVGWLLLFAIGGLPHFVPTQTITVPPPNFGAPPSPSIAPPRPPQITLPRISSGNTQVRCSSNLRQIGQAIALYQNDNQGQFPASFQELE